MFKQNVTKLALLGILFGASSAAQAYMIDDFNGPNDLLDSAQFVQIGHDLPSNADSSESPTTSGTGTTIGGYRDVYLHNPSVPSDELSNITVGANTTSNPGLYIFNDSDPFTPDAVTTTATATLIWDGGPDDPTTVNTSGLGSINITDGGTAQGFYLDAFYLSAGVTMTLTVWTNGGTNSDTAFVTSVAGEDLFLSFASFSGLDFTDVSAIQADFTGPDEYEVQAYSLQTTPTPAAVPEPSTLALSVIGLLGLARRRAIR